MKLGVIADIHGDLDALKLALSFFDDQEIDQIVCAGDLVEKGPDNEAVVELLQIREILSIAGNHDNGAVSKNSLSAEASIFLNALPQTLVLTIDNKRIFVAHGTPWSEYIYVYPKTEKHVFKRVVFEANADVVLLGHTHSPLAAQIRQAQIYNPGSICGTYTKGSRTCGILSLPECSFEVYELDTRQPTEIAQIRIMR